MGQSHTNFVIFPQLGLKHEPGFE